MHRFQTIDEMRAWSRQRAAAGQRIGLVPTLGSLHEGHRHLVDSMREHVDHVVVSIFVNPTQFGAGEDLEQYPRDIDRDRQVLQGCLVDCLFHPTVSEMYPTPGVISVESGVLGQRLCGRTRQGHFAGVLTVVLKLMHIVEPHVALFGRKDYQQLVLIKRMVRDLDLPIDVLSAPIVRDADGLAVSSRNQYLSGEHRQAAPVIARALDAAHAYFCDGERAPTALVERARTVLDAQPEIEVEYLEVVHQASLAALPTAEASSVMALAVRLGQTRLIDNIALGSGTRADTRVPA